MIARRAPVPRRGRDRERLGAGRALHPHHLATATSAPTTPRSAGCARSGCASTSSTARSTRSPLRRDRHRRADRRQPREPARRAWSAASSRRRSSIPGTATSARRRPRCAARPTGPSWPASSQPVLARGGDRRRRRLSPRAVPAPAEPTARDLLPALEPERRLTDWGRSERIEGAARPDGRRLLLPPVVPLRGRGDRARPVGRRRAARLQPRRRAAARRADDRQGDQGGAPAPAAAAPHGRALLQGLSGLQHAAAEDRRRPRPPGQRAPAALRRGAARAGLPRGPQGFREALQGPLPPAPLRPRRVRRGGDARPRADRARRRRRAPRRRRRSSPTSRRCSASPASSTSRITPTFPHFGLLGMLGYLPAKFVIRFLPPVPTDDLGRRAVGGQGARADDRRRGSRRHPGGALDMLGRRRSVWFG